MDPDRYALSPEEFEDAVGDGLDRLPQALLDRMDNVVILVEEEPTPEQLRSVDLPGAHGSGRSLFGLYEGTPLPQRGEFYPPTVPDRISIFRGPLSRAFRSPQRLREEAARTVIHEVAHHFGISDERLHELGWG
ncbi:Predicted Zn-dependent protease, minimal metalloprotease (MMP)-like domain [Kytococcus aerolatus]|uniref:Predicted Zn-dependent protease, minimal metalloprotease (MMP)-like domain n=1 Tax=Kytococcus aerolatus TaxID=592308 RepID=A0A212T3Y4_9MICO|nr:metallopeptidase family protein [Kytococcus aerolatus]SNC60752.1 Predicted Zn-dependent protease, minimal metalloprotease (MMP)-like domain [Kytococcus aerolatus]